MRNVTCFQGVLQVEQKLGGKLLDRPKSMPFQDGGANLCLCIEDVAQGWRCKPGANYQVRIKILVWALNIQVQSQIRSDHD